MAVFGPTGKVRGADERVGAPRAATWFIDAENFLSRTKILRRNPQLGHSGGDFWGEVMFDTSEARDHGLDVR
jgi:hypothetical protein